MRLRALFQGMVNYNIELCNSRVAQKRAEALVSQSKAEGRILIGGSPRGARRFFKKAIRKGMTDGTFDKIVSTYLIGRQPGFGLADVERETRRRRAKRTETAR